MLIALLIFKMYEVIISGADCSAARSGICDDEVVISDQLQHRDQTEQQLLRAAAEQQQRAAQAEGWTEN